jgi:hypothetical protein
MVIQHAPSNPSDPTYNKKTADDEDAGPMHLVAATQPEEAGLPPPDVSWLAQIEQLVGDLAMAVERGDVRADRVFKGRIRAVADRLLTLIGDDDRGALN